MVLDAMAPMTMRRYFLASPLSTGLPLVSVTSLPLLSFLKPKRRTVVKRSTSVVWLEPKGAVTFDRSASCLPSIDATNWLRADDTSMPPLGAMSTRAPSIWSNLSWLLP